MLILGLAAIARADGGLPITLQVRFAADKPDSLYIMTNYGVMISDDLGCTWRWICEPNVGYGGAYIPEIAVARDGTIYATSFFGLRISRDGGCNFTSTISEGYVAGLAIDESDAIWASTAQSSVENDVYQSTDNGATFVPRGLASTTHRWSTIRAAGGRVYVSGADEQKTAQLRRLDGTVWTPLPTTGIEVGTPPTLRIAAIDPDNTDIVYVISERNNADLLYRSGDGGMTWQLVHQAASGKLTDVVVIDTSRVVVTALEWKGIVLEGGQPKLSTDRGLTFAEWPNVPTMACATVAPNGKLHACGANWEPDYAAIIRNDDDAWTKVFRFTELAGPLQCGMGSGQATKCEPLWPAVENNFLPSGPVCGPLAVEPPMDGPPMHEPPDSCCGVGARPTSLVWAFAVLALLSAFPCRRPR